VKYTLALHRDIVAGAVDALGLERIVLVAEDWGGPLGMHHLVHEPQLYEAVILMETFLRSFTFADDYHPKFRMPFRLMRGPAGFVAVQVFNIMTKKVIPEHCPITSDGMQYSQLRADDPFTPGPTGVRPCQPAAREAKGECAVH
jgi:haloalkane dehalogenase